MSRHNDFLSYLSRTPKEIQGDKAIKNNNEAHLMLDKHDIPRFETYLTDENECKMKYYSLVERIEMYGKSRNIPSLTRGNS